MHRVNLRHQTLSHFSPTPQIYVLVLEQIDQTELLVTLNQASAQWWELPKIRPTSMVIRYIRCVSEWVPGLRWS
jgi:hypothetical protein